MGLLDNMFDSLNTPAGMQGLGLLAAAGPRADGAGFGQRLMEGINAGRSMTNAQMQQQMQQLQFMSAMRRNQLINQAMEADQNSGQPQQAGQPGAPVQAQGLGQTTTTTPAVGPGQTPDQGDGSIPAAAPGANMVGAQGSAPAAQAQPWSAQKINLYAMSGDPGLQKAAELAQARQLAGQTDIGKLMAQAGIDPNSVLGRQMTQQAIAKANNLPPTRLAEGTYYDPVVGGVVGLPAAAPPGYINVRNPSTGVWSTQQVTGGVDAVENSAAALASGKNSVEPEVRYDDKGNALFTSKLAAATGGGQQRPQQVPSGPQTSSDQSMRAQVSGDIGMDIPSAMREVAKAKADYAMLSDPQSKAYDPKSAQLIKGYIDDVNGQIAAASKQSQSATQAPASTLAPTVMRAGAPVGSTNNVNLLQSQGADLLKGAQADAFGNRQTSQYFDEIQNMLGSGAKFGPMQADIAKWKAMVPGVDLSGAQTNQDVMRKIAANLAGARGTRSDADLTNWQKAYPNGDMTNQAIQQVLPMLRQTLAVSDARANVLTNASANGLEGLPTVANNFNQIASPSIINAGQQLAAASKAGQVNDFLTKFKAQYPQDWGQRLQTIKQLDTMGAF